MKENGQQRATKLIYTKCDEYSDPSPIIRENFDLMSALKDVSNISVGFSIFIHVVIKIYIYHRKVC